MNSFKKWISRSSMVLGVTLFLSFSIIGTSFAEDSGTNALLKQILNVSYSILTAINQLPAYLNDLTTMAKSWNDTNDTNNIISNIQGDFATLARDDYVNYTQQIKLSNQLTTQFLKAGGSLPSNSYELGYSILTPESPLSSLGDASLDKAQLNYLSYISGANIIFQQSNPGWTTEQADKYNSVYNAVSAITSYNSYILSNLYTNQNTNTTREDLIAQATNSTWFTTVGSESIGLVLRHILMYISQIYVGVDQMVKTQQKQLTVQAMTNTLLIIYANFSVAQALSGTANAAMVRG